MQPTDDRTPAAGAPVERPVRPTLLTEKELLDIVDSLIRDRAFNRPAAVAIAMAVGAAVEAVVRERCARICESEPERKRGDGVWAADQRACAEAIRGA